jgi:serine phosphatase RsbU (regulator of sigma subunit)
VRERSEALEALIEAVGTALRADAAAVRLREAESGDLVARPVWASSTAVAAELVGSRRRQGALDADDCVLCVPIRQGEEIIGELELVRSGEPFGDEDRALAEAVAAHAALVLASELGVGMDGGSGRRERDLALAAEALALAASGDAAQLVRLAAEAGGASGALLWRTGADEPLVLAAETEIDEARIPELESIAGEMLDSNAPVAVGRSVASVRLGEPPLGVLQLVFEGGAEPLNGAAGLLATFGVRAAQALRAGESLVETEAELERSRALVAVISQAIAQLSLSHTLETAVDRIAELLGVERVAVYLLEGGRLQPVSGRGLIGPHARVAERLLALALGPFRGRQALLMSPAEAGELLASVRGELAESGIEGLLAVPLLAPDTVVGLVAVYPEHGRSFEENEVALLSALAAQLAVVVENARLHEEAKLLGSRLEDALAAEREFARRLRAQYEISHSFTHSLSLQATLEAVTRTVVETLAIDAAVMRLPDGRGEVLEPRSVYVADPRLDGLRSILGHDQPVAAPRVRRLLRSGEPILLDRRSAAELAGHELLVPFLERGGTAVVIPVATPSEALATLTLVSLDPAQPLRGEIVDVALSIAAQAALAIDNARLYQQQKSFADTMQRSLLPRSEPELPGLDIGTVYESSARVDVGGDLFDFLVIPDGRLAVVLGDVTGHGIEAAADMAMAKFVFRSLTREHPQPGDFLASANDVVAGEIATGKFITLVYVLVDPGASEVACANAGHPSARLIGRGGEIVELQARGLALGVDEGQTYDEVRVHFGQGDALVLYTDGLVERRRGKELYGTERLDEMLVRGRELPARQLARAILADCRAFGSGDLTDDCAIVVIKRSSTTDP